MDECNILEKVLNSLFLACILSKDRRPNSDFQGCQMSGTKMDQFQILLGPKKEKKDQNANFMIKLSKPAPERNEPAPE